VTVSTDPCLAPIGEVARRLRGGELSPRELVEATLRRIDTLNPTLHAYYHVFADEALDAAGTAGAELVRGVDRGPLHGVPVALKDVIECGPTTGGSAALRDHVAGADAEVVERLRAAGAIVVGKLATYELAFGASSYGDLFPPARNPWAPELDPGGSSTGAGVAVATGMAHAAIGSDTGGSVRLPAAFCGIVGLKPTYDRISRRGLIPLAPSLDHVGPLARTAGDAAIVLEACCDAVAPAAPLEPAGLRIGVPWAFFEASCDARILAAFATALEVLVDLGADVVDVEFDVSFAEASATFWAIIAAEAAREHHELCRASPPPGREARVIFETGRLVDAVLYLDAQRARAVVAAAVERLLAGTPVLALPTVGMMQRPIPEQPFGPERRVADPPAPIYTLLANLCGTPAVSLPCGFDGATSLPIGLQLMAGPFRDRELLDVAAAYEATAGWTHRRPGAPTT
jgi:aspartyl-tRNA(Asn)/glutamyl-tRNA(Gln) amidotransferase subunit A